MCPAIRAANRASFSLRLNCLKLPVASKTLTVKIRRTIKSDSQPYESKRTLSSQDFTTKGSLEANHKTVHDPNNVETDVEQHHENLVRWARSQIKLRNQRQYYAVSEVDHHRTREYSRQRCWSQPEQKESQVQEQDARVSIVRDGQLPSRTGRSSSMGTRKSVSGVDWQSVMAINGAPNVDRLFRQNEQVLFLLWEFW